MVASGGGVAVPTAARPRLPLRVPSSRAWPPVLEGAYQPFGPGGAPAARGAPTFVAIGGYPASAVLALPHRRI